MNDILPDSVIVALVYGILQLLKPFVNKIMPQDKAWQNNAYRAIGFLLTYGFLCVNRMVIRPVLWPDLWGLLPVAGALFSSSAMIYSIATDGGAPGDSPSFGPPRHDR